MVPASLSSLRLVWDWAVGSPADCILGVASLEIGLYSRHVGCWIAHCSYVLQSDWLSARNAASDSRAITLRCASNRTSASTTRDVRYRVSESIDGLGRALQDAQG